MRDFQSPGRSAVYGTSAMIATSHPEASLVGIEIMRRGGSAVDAAIAACALLGVVEPAMTGIGGDCFAIVSRPGEPPTTLNGSGRAPAAASIDRLRERGIEAIVDDSPDAVTIPGAPDAWYRLHADYGRLELSELMEPAARRAEEGYPLAPRVAFDWARHSQRLSRHPQTAAAFLTGGAAPLAGDIHRQPALAATLRAFGRLGREAFYAGDVAEDIVETLQTLGGVHSLDDFAAQRATYEDPLIGRFAGTDILECPPNGQGATALLILRALETWDAFREASDENVRLRLYVEACRAAYVLRDRAIGDPSAMSVGMDKFLSPEAVSFVHRYAGQEIAPDSPIGPAPWETDTIYLSAVDRDGLVVSFINSLFVAFGSTILAPRSGVMLHCRGTSFRLDPRHPNALGPRKRPMHTIIPGLAMRAGRVVLPFGVMGGQYQAAGHAHLMVRLFQESMELQSAIDAPRAFGYGAAVQVESGIAPAAIAELEASGHVVQRMDAPLGGAQAIFIDHARGVLVGASDPRKDGCALGY